jgi:hypothetical protein
MMFLFRMVDLRFQIAIFDEGTLIPFEFADQIEKPSLSNFLVAHFLRFSMFPRYPPARRLAAFVGSAATSRPIASVATRKS